MLDMVAVVVHVVVSSLLSRAYCVSDYRSLCALSTDRLAVDVNNRLLHEGLKFDSY